MRKSSFELDPVGDDSLGSNRSNESDDLLIGDAIIEEEERLIAENDRIVDKEKFKYLKDAKENIENDEDLMKKAESEMREKRYKRLIHLLRNSKMYATILKNKMKDEAPARRETRNVTKTSDDAILKKQRSHEKYTIGEVLTEKDIEENTLEDEKSSRVENFDTDYFIKTRVTKLGLAVSYKQPILLEGGIMRDYQLQGLEWMINLFLNGVNGILADEMGLGKTIQVIAFICYLIEQNIQGPFLIIAPLTTVTNWMAEFKRFAPEIPTILYYGTETERKGLLSKILQKSEGGKFTAHKVVITSYQMPILDTKDLGKINWYYIIIDEAQRIKNYNAVLSRALRGFNTIGRLLLTGTPLQNDLSELWSLLNFLLPEVFSSLDVFESWFDITELEENGTKFIKQKFNLNIINILQEILIPFVLRREKKDVNLQLPPKKEVLIYCPMTQRQKKFYEATLARSIEFLVKPKGLFVVEEPLSKRRCFLNNPYGKTKISEQHVKAEPPNEDERFKINLALANPQMQLRKIVNHPYLIQYPLIIGTEMLRIDEDLIRESGKLLVLDAMLPKLKDGGHKVLLYSFFKIMLDILEDYANLRGYRYCRLDGNSQISDRDEEISKFTSDPDIFIFLVSIRAGGLGINLTAADTAIFIDSDWNPQVNLQAADRCHRIGQTKPVIIYRFCTSGTIDEKIIERGNAKRRLEKMILQKGKFAMKRSVQLNLLDLQELKKLLESTNHDIVIKSNDSVFTDKELEALLDRSKLCSDTSSIKDSRVFKVLNYEK